MKNLICAGVSGLLVALCTSAAGGDLVALKRDSGLVFSTDINGGGDVDADTVSDARWQGSVTVVTDAAADTRLYRAGNGRYTNYGTSSYISTFQSRVLFKFDIDKVSGLAGGTVELAELRFAVRNGNTGNMLIGPIRSFDWSEGNKDGKYPGADLTGSGEPGPAPGATYAHPNGQNTGANQDASGGTGNPLQSWGDGNDFWSASPLSGNASISPDDSVTPGDGDESAEVTRKGTSPGSAGEVWFVYDVTSIVQDWVDGAESNFGLYWISRDGSDVERDFNWNVWPSEQDTGATNVAAEVQPVLFIDFTPAPVPEPATMLLLGLGGVAMAGAARRRRA